MESVPSLRPTSCRFLLYFFLLPLPVYFFAFRFLLTYSFLHVFPYLLTYELFFIFGVSFPTGDVAVRSPRRLPAILSPLPPLPKASPAPVPTPNSLPLRALTNPPTAFPVAPKRNHPNLMRTLLSPMRNLRIRRRMQFNRRRSHRILMISSQHLNPRRNHQSPMKSLRLWKNLRSPISHLNRMKLHRSQKKNR